MKLAKFLAQCGIASRRKAEEIITSGAVSINGVETRNVAIRVEDQDIVRYQGNILRAPTEHLTIALYKPAGVVTTTQDELGREHVLELLPQKFQQLKPVGRLDKNSEGLLLLTSDGTLHNQLTHPKFQKEKEYLVTVKGKVTPEHIETLQRGVTIKTEEGPYKTKPAKIMKVEYRPSTTVFALVIKEGKKRQIRLMCTALGYTVTTLKRIRIGQVHLQGLSAGKWRLLSKKELESLNSL